MARHQFSGPAGVDVSCSGIRPSAGLFSKAAMAAALSALAQEQAQGGLYRWGM